MGLLGSEYVGTYVPGPTQSLTPHILTKVYVPQMVLATSKNRISRLKCPYQQYSTSSTACTSCAALTTPEEMSLRSSILARLARLMFPIASTTCSRA